MKPNPAQQATVETLRTAAKRLRLGVEGQRTADELEAIADSMEAARELTAAQGVDGLDFEPDDNHTVADMANVGYSLMQAIKQNCPDYSWNESPAEIVADLSNQWEEALAELAALSQPIEPQGAVVGAIRGLITQWRHNAQGCGKKDAHAAGTWRSCARELEAALPVAVGAGEVRCPHCDDTGDVHGSDGEWRGVCSCPAGKRMVDDNFLRIAIDAYADVFDGFPGSHESAMRAALDAVYSTQQGDAK